MDLIIPELGINAPIVRGIDDPSLRHGVGVDPLSSVPGVPGNSVIAGHRNVWGAWFWDLPSLKPGSQIFVKTPEATYTYKVAFTRVAQPHDISLLEPPTDPKVTRLTLYTCTKPKTDCRFVVVANLVKKETAPIAIPSSTLATTKATAPKTTPAKAPLATLPQP
jgi:sortase A